MKYTREKGVLRILVGCLDFRRIPAKERIFIANGFYDISFEVEVQRDLEMVTANAVDDEPSDNGGHGNNGDSTAKSPKNKDAMDTDSTPNLQDQEGANLSSASGPDINKLAGEFSAGVKFSPRVKLMMEQSRLEISALIKSLAGSAAVAENSAESADAASPAAMSPPVVEPDVSAATANIVSVFPAAAPTASRASAPGTPSAGAGFSHTSAAAARFPAGESGPADNAVCPAAATLPAAEARISVDPGLQSCARASSAGKLVERSPASEPSSPPSSGGSPAHASTEMDTDAVGVTAAESQKRSFHSSPESEGKVLRGSKTACTTVYTTEEAAQLPPSKRAAGEGTLEDSASAPPQGKRHMPLANPSPRIAAVPFSPSTPSRKIKDVIAFGGIREENASPIRSSMRVRMQPNSDATQLERATQLVEKRFHTLSPGTKTNLSFSKFTDIEIVARATTLGVSLGSNISEIQQSINSLKQTEEDRRVTYLQNNLNERLGVETECDILNTANQLCSDFDLEDRVTPMGDSSDPVLDMPIKSLLKRNKKKAANLGVAVRRSTRIKKAKINSK
jgi:hypothetical protein